MNTVGGFRVPVQDRLWRTSSLPRTEMNTVDRFRVQFRIEPGEPEEPVYYLGRR